MAFFVARRLFYLLPVLIAVSLLTFSIASLLPGDLAYTILGDQATPEKVAALRHDMGLDQPIWWRYLSWLGNAVPPYAAPAILLFIGGVIATIGAALGPETRDADF